MQSVFWFFFLLAFLYLFGYLVWRWAGLVVGRGLLLGHYYLFLIYYYYLIYYYLSKKNPPMYYYKGGRYYLLFSFIS